MEEWRAVVGEADYEVSNLGRVRSLTSLVWYGPAVGFGVRTGKILKSSVDGHGYLTVRAGKLKTQKVHILVARAFIGPCPDLHEVRHLDDNKQNPVLSNLEYGTKSQNRMDAYRNGICSPEKDLEIGRKTRETKDRKYGRRKWVRAGLVGIKYPQEVYDL